jgi:hypothetical protein
MKKINFKIMLKKAKIKLMIKNKFNIKIFLNSKALFKEYL